VPTVEPFGLLDALPDAVIDTTRVGEPLDGAVRAVAPVRQFTSNTGNGV
jgi:hypothetical protein